MYKWVIVKPRTNDDPSIVTIWAPVLKLAERSFQLYFTDSDNLNFALSSIYAEDARWCLANCLFDTKKQAEWYIKTKLRFPADYIKPVRPALYWVDDYSVRELEEALDRDKNEPEKGLLNEYLSDLYSNMI